MDLALRERVEDLWTPRGLVKVEIRDAETGHLDYFDERENFVSVQSYNVARWFQRMMWGILNPVVANDSDGVSPKAMPYFPADHLAAWNDAAAEDSANEHRVGAPIVAWASRLPIGSPTGKRGVVNITESEFTAAHAKWVFDWATSQGNGTFRSVGWTRLHESAEAPYARLVEPGTVVSFSGMTGAGTTNRTGGGLYWDGTNWFTVDRPNTSDHRLLSFPSTGGGSPTAVFTIPSTAFSDTSHTCVSLCKLGTDWYFVGSTISGSRQPRIAKLNSSGVQQWAVTATEIPASQSFNDVTTDGTNIFAACTDGKIYRIDPANGNRTAVITPSDSPSGVIGIAYDSGSGNFWIVGGNGKLYQVQSDGTVVVGPQMSIFTTGEGSVTTTSPYVGSYVVPGARYTDPYRIAHGDPVGSTTGRYDSDGGAPLVDTWVSGFTDLAAGKQLTPITFKGTDLYVVQRSSYFIQKTGKVDGHNLGTRVRLTSDATKSNTQTMKITYQFDFS